MIVVSLFEYVSKYATHTSSQLGLLLLFGLKGKQSKVITKKNTLQYTILVYIQVIEFGGF